LQSRFFIFTINAMLFSIFSTKKTIHVFCLSVFLLCSCAKVENADKNENSPANQAANGSIQKNDAQTAKDDLEELEKIIKLPAAPEEATYREDDLNAQNKEPNANAAIEKRLTAVLKFSAADASRIVEQAAKYKPSATSEIEAEDWFPAELVAQSQLSGDETLKGETFAADDFFQSPYAHGNLTRIGNTNYFVLELSAF